MLEDHFEELIGEKCGGARSSPLKGFRGSDASSTRFGIDTLRLSLATFSIRNDNFLRVRTAAAMRKADCSLARKQSVRRDKPIHLNGEGREVCGDNAKWRSTETGAKVHVRHGLNGGLTCVVEFSVPRVDSGINYPGADQSALKRVLHLIQETLYRIGIETSIMEARLSRVDGCFDRQMEMPPAFYAAVAECLHMPYERTRRFHSRGSSGDGFCLGCGSNRVQLNMYDKSHQMKECHRVDLGTPHNVLRSEIQLRSGAKIREVLEMTTARDLIEQFDRLRGVFERLIRPIFVFNVDWSIYESEFNAWSEIEELQGRRV